MLQYFELLKVGSHQVFAIVNPKVVLKIASFQIGSLLIFCDITKNIIGKYWKKLCFRFRNHWVWMGPNDKIRTSFSLDPLIDELFSLMLFGKDEW